MASRQDFVDYVCEQISGAGVIRARKMFGDYGVYCDDKIIGLVCDDRFFVKKTAAGAAILPDCPEAAPYEGAKAQFLVEELDDRELLARFIAATWAELPAPKPKKKKPKA